MNRNTAIICAVISSMLSSLAWVFQGQAVLSLTPLSVASAQGILSGIIYLIHIRITGKKIPFEICRKYKAELIEFTFLRGFVASILLCYALLSTESIKVMFFTKLEPYFVLFWAWLLTGKTIHRYHAFLLAIHIMGAVLLSTGGHIDIEHSQWGDVMLISAVAILSYSYLHAAKLSKELGSVHVNGISALTSGICLLPLAILVSPVNTWNFFSVGWLNVLILVLLFNVFGLTLWYTALRNLDGWLVSALRGVGPVCAAPIAWVLFGQHLSLVQVEGAVIVLLTSIILTIDKSHEQKATN